MKCRFCGKRIKRNENICSKCGQEINAGLNTDELIDAMPELHDEFDNISKMREKEKQKKEKKEKRAKNKTKRIVIAIIIVVAILGGVAAGLLWWKNKEQEELASEPVVTTSAVESVVKKAFISGEAIESLVTDEHSAKMLIAEHKDVFLIEDANTEFVIDKKIEFANTITYRFNQMYKGLLVYGGEMVIMADNEGNVIGLNGRYIPTKDLTTTSTIDQGSASTAITEYVNSLDGLAVVDGINITEIEKVVCNKDDTAYLAYMANVSGYNSSSEYIGYDVFVDGVGGSGICVSVTSSFENENTMLADEVENSYIYEMATASNKFNWNDESMSLAEEPINIEDIEAGNASAYVTSVKSTVDTAYNYFKNAFGWAGLSGNGETFKVYINSNEYVEEDLPTEKAMYTNGKLMFFREDLTQGDIDYNTVVHEYAHGVMHNLVGFNGTMALTENAAIAEGLADVFGELAEATLNGTSPDWIHGERNLLNPSEKYLVAKDESKKINNITDCYRHSTIVSYAAANIAQNIPSIAVQNELWFKSMCFMTKSTDFSELGVILNTVAASMYNQGKLDDTQYNTIIYATQVF